MRTPHIATQCAYADRVLAKSLSASVGDAELGSYLSSYLVVMLSGLYEDCIEHLIDLRVQRTGDSEVGSYVAKTLQATFRNPTFENVLGLLGKFSKQYANRLKTAVHERDAQALDSIVNNKNAIAHGMSSNLTLKDVEDFHRRTIVILEALENILV